MPYRIGMAPAARRQWNKLPRAAQDRIAPHILALESDPRPSGCRKLSEPLQGYRIRIGDYRVIYTVDDPARVVTVHKVAPRDTVYG